MDHNNAIEAVDEYFSEPYIDSDEWRDSPVRHRYVHGGFANTETRFSIYLPPSDQYDGRFFQHITPVPDSENLAQASRGAEDKIGFSIASGAYFLETNGGGVSGSPGSAVDPTIAAYRANAAAAQYSRVVAAQMYGEQRPFGYCYGGSGGGYRTIGGAENTAGVWDGFVPYVIGSPMAIPNVFAVRMHAQRILKDCFDQIVDALEPGGSGDMFAGLTVEQRDALVEVTKMGFPSRSWFGHRTMGLHAFPVLYRGLTMADPKYFDQFWTEPGYLGHDAPESLQPYVVEHRCQVAMSITDHDAVELGLLVRAQPGHRGGVDVSWRGADAPPAIPVAVRLTSTPTVEMHGGELIIISGAAAGARLLVNEIVDDIAVFGPGDTEVMARLQPGDEVEVNNRGFLAAQTYHRHQVPSSDFAVWDQFRNPDGSPLYPQRPLLLGPLFAAAAAGTVQTGKFTGKMIVVESLLDREAFPWQADWYRSRVEEDLGDTIDEHFRVWFVDHALHGDSDVQDDPTHAVSYLGVLHQALRDLSRWVEQGVAPPPSTNYSIVDGQVVVPIEANERAGVQPVVTFTVDGAECATVAADTEVSFQVLAHLPHDTGEIVSVEWDFDGAGLFPVRELMAASDRAAVERRHSFTEPGTHFATVRVTSQREGDTTSSYARIQNLARVRVVVR